MCRSPTIACADPRRRPPMGDGTPMLTDIRLLLWLGAKRLWPQLRYWGSFLGIDSESHPLLRLYISLFWLAWAVALVFLGAHQAELLGRQLQPSLRSVLVAALPVLIGLAQAAYAIDRAFRCPIRLDAGDRVWLAPSRVRPESVALVNALRDGLPPMALASTGLSFLYVVLATALGPGADWATAGWVGLAAALLAYATHAAIWCLQALSWRPSPYRSRWIWLSAGGILVLVMLVFPEWATMPGRWLVAEFAGTFGVLQVGLVAAAALLMTAGGAALSRDVDWARVVRANRQRIERSRYGFLADLFGLPSFAQSEREATVLRSFNLPIRFNARSGVFSLLFTRSTLTMWRLAPKSLVDPLLRSAAVGVAVTVILRVTNIGDLASWLLFFLLLLQGRRLGLTRHLRLDRERVFMGQFVAAGKTAVIGTWLMIPVGLSVVGSGLAMVSAPIAEIPLYFVLSLSLIVLIALCEVAEIYDVPFVKGIRMPYEYWICLAGLPMAWVGLATHSVPFVCLAAAGTVAAGLVQWFLSPVR